jgi:hypothetical protein
MSEKRKTELTRSHRAFFKRHKVEPRFQLINPERAWKRGENRSRVWEEHKKFFATLSKERKRLWKELLCRNIKEALMTERYLHPKDGVPLPQRLVALQFGLQGRANYASRFIRGVVQYLKPSRTATKEAVLAAQRIRRKVQRLRDREEREMKEKETREALEKLAGGPLPSGVQEDQFPNLELVLRALRDGRMERLRRHHAREYVIIMRHLGLERGSKDTLQVIGDDLGITRERVRQIEWKGFRRLRKPQLLEVVESRGRPKKSE